MFWKYNSAPSPQIETILAKEDVTLQDLMDEDEIINECRLQNNSLIEFLVKPEVIDELVTLTIQEPSGESEDNLRFKYSNIACEILTCDISTLNERLASDEKLLTKLYGFLEGEPPLNSLLASFFSKIMSVLIAKLPEQNWLSHQLTCLQVIDFFKAKEDFVPLLLKHIGTSAIMDLMLKLMTQVEGVETWLDSYKIIQSLVSLLDPTIDKHRHYNVSELLCDFIKISRDKSCVERNEPDVLFPTLESPETISLLLDSILGDVKCESCIVGGIQVLLALLNVGKSCDEGENLKQRQIVVQKIASAISKRLKDFHDLLLNPPKKEAVSMTIGVLDPPLGNTRLQVTRLFAALISTGSPDLMKEVTALGTLEVLLDLFFKFRWNNFLHTQVEACITSALEAQVPSETQEDNALYKHLLVNCKLVDRILEAWKDNDEQQSQPKGVRLGYMGHLTNIANTIRYLCSTTPLGEYMQKNLPELAESFEQFSTSMLEEINAKRNILLGGSDPTKSTDFSESTYQPNVGPQQAFEQYESQQITPQFIETYGFNDNEFTDGDNTLQTIGGRRSLNFELSAEDLDLGREDLFSQFCDQTINTLDDVDDQIFEDKDKTTLYKVVEKPSEQHNAYSSDSDDETSPCEDPFAGVDPWASNETEQAIAPISAEDPWASGEKTPAEAMTTNWASFSSPSFENFEANFDDAPRLSAERDVPPNPAVPEAAEAAYESADSIQNVAQVVVNEAVSKASIQVQAAGDQGPAKLSSETTSTTTTTTSIASSLSDSCKLEPEQSTVEQLPSKEGV